MYMTIQEEIVQEAKVKVERAKYAYEKAKIDLHMEELRLQAIEAGFEGRA